MRISVALLGVAAVAVAAPAFAAPAGGDYAKRLEFIKSAGPGRYFGDVAVRTDRPTPWHVFAAARYRYVKGGGPPIFGGRGAVYGEGGDGGSDAEAAVWLAILDDDFRKNAALTYMPGGKVPGVPADRWLSLNDFENEVMVTVVHSPASFDDPRVEKDIKDLVRRATALHNLSWEELPLTPGASGTGWSPLEKGTPAAREAAALKAAYHKRDGAAMRRAAESLARLLSAQPGYPRPGLLRLEVWMSRLPVFVTGLAFYALAALALFLSLVAAKKVFARVAVGTAIAGLAVAAAGLAARSLIAGDLPAVGVYDRLVLLSWATAFWYVVLSARLGASKTGLVLLPAACVCLIVAAFFPAEIPGLGAPAYNSPWFKVHVVTLALAGGAFAAAFAASVARPAAGAPADNGGFSYRATAWGYLLFAVGALAARGLWLQSLGGFWWRWDAGAAVSLITLVLVTVYTHGRTLRGRRNAPAAILTAAVLSGAVIALFAEHIFSGPAG